MIKSVLITGGSGLVGKNFMEHAETKNYTIFSPSHAEVDLLEFEQINNFLKDKKPDLIIHAAGIVGGIQANIKNPIKFLIQNTDMGKNLLLAAKKQNVKRLINLSSSCVYPKNYDKPLYEELILSGELEPTNEAYAIAKIFIQKLCSYINSENNSFLYKTLIPCNLFGRFDNFDLETGHLLPNIINKIYNAKKNGSKEVHVWGNGSVRREFMYAADLADFLFYCIKNFEIIPSTLNVGIGHDYSVLDYYKAVAKSLSWKGTFVFDLSKPVGQKQKTVSIEKLKKTGWYSSTSLDKAIGSTIKYFVEEHQNVL
jgi:nucleoside-diphosphate-sugar epimerase